MKRTCAAVSIAGFLAFGLAAEGWRIDLGGGLGYGPLYSGSEETDFSPFPVAELAYVGSSYKLFAGIINGVGLEFEFEDTGFGVKTAFDLGESRMVDFDDLPEGAAKVQSPFKASAEAGWELGLLGLGTKLEASPIREKLAGSEPRNGWGVICSPCVQTRIPLSGDLLYIDGEAGVTLMDEGYARAWYGARGFSAGAGFERAYAEAMFVWLGVLPHVWLCAKYECAHLLGDAAESPVSGRDFEQRIAVFAAFRIRRR